MARTSQWRREFVLDYFPPLGPTRLLFGGA